MKLAVVKSSFSDYLVPLFKLNGELLLRRSYGLAPMDIVELVTTVLLALFVIAAFCGVSKTGEAPFGPTIAFLEIM